MHIPSHWIDDGHFQWLQSRNDGSESRAREYGVGRVKRVASCLAIPRHQRLSIIDYQSWVAAVLDRMTMTYTSTSKYTGRA